MTLSYCAVISKCTMFTDVMYLQIFVLCTKSTKLIQIKCLQTDILLLHKGYQQFMVYHDHAMTKKFFNY